jgi:hypothetical protein
VFYQSFPSVGAFGAFLALKLSRSQRLWQGAGAVHSQHLSLHVYGARRTPKNFLYDLRGTATITTASTPRATRRRGVRYARGTRRTLCSQDCQRAPRKLSVHAVVLSASCSPLYCPGASRPRQACSCFTSRFRDASYCRRLDLECDKHGIGGGSKHCDDSRLVRIMFPNILSRRFAPAASVQSSNLTLSGCQLLSQGGPRVRQARHRRRQQTL